MGHCKYCKHWGHGEALRSADYAPKKHCAFVLTNDTQSPVTISVGGNAEYGDDPADLLTAPDFGCVLFQAKEPA